MGGSDPEMTRTAFTNIVYEQSETDLTIEEANRILCKLKHFLPPTCYSNILLANPDMTKISNAPAVHPKGGDIYVYSLKSLAKNEIGKIAFCDIPQEHNNAFITFS